MAKGFACGINLRQPVDLPADCKANVSGFFRFYTLNDCSAHKNIYLVTFIQNLSRKKSRVGDNVGFWEVRPSTIPYREFVVEVLKANPRPSISESAMSNYIVSAS